MRPGRRAARASLFTALWNARQRLADESGLHIARIEHLLRRYGTLIHDLLQLVAEEPKLGQPLEGAPDYLRVEMSYGASHEGALYLDDLLARRTRISIDTFDRGVAAAPEVAAAQSLRPPARDRSRSSGDSPLSLRYPGSSISACAVTDMDLP